LEREVVLRARDDAALDERARVPLERFGAEPEVWRAELDV
jgi:hypothetical protein